MYPQCILRVQYSGARLQLLKYLTYWFTCSLELPPSSTANQPQRLLYYGGILESHCGFNQCKRRKWEKKTKTTPLPWCPRNRSIWYCRLYSTKYRY